LVAVEQLQTYHQHFDLRRIGDGAACASARMALTMTSRLTIGYGCPTKHLIARGLSRGMKHQLPWSMLSRQKPPPSAGPFIER
jgi:hypothetical protein